MTEVLRLEKICFGFSANCPEIHNLSLSVRSGEYKSVANELSVEESSLLKIIIGEQKPSSGSGTLLGYPLLSLSASRRRQLLRQMGIIPKTDYASDETLSQFVALPLRIAGMRTSLIDQRVRSFLADLELTLLARRSLSTLTRNQRRLAVLAQALIKAPKLVIWESRLDEFDCQAIEPLLRKYSRYGGAVLELAPRHNASLTPSSAREGAYAPA